jgi:hypothetical protein
VSAALAMVFFTVFLQVGSFFYENYVNEIIAFNINGLHLLYIKQQGALMGRNSNPTLPHANNL